MTSPALAIAAYRLRRTWRSRLGGYLTVVLLLGLIGGLALASLAGARRTASAYPSYLAASSASDLEMQSTVSSLSADSVKYSPALTRRIAALPDVRRVAAAVSIIVAPVDAHGKADLVAPLQDNEVDSIGGVGGRYFTNDRVVVDEGRMPDPRRAGEFAMTADAARLLHWHVGHVVSLGAYTLDQLFNSPGGPPAHPALRLRGTLVGIVAFASSVVHDQVDRFPAHILFTPALTDTLLAAGGAGFTDYALTLRHGAADVPAVEQQLVRILPPSSTYTFHVTAVAEDQVQRAIKPEAIALAAFGIFAALAVLFVAGQAASRAVRSRTQELDVLRALGAGPLSVLGDALLGTWLAVAAGALLAGVVGVLLSPVAPLGAVRQIDPSPGFSADWPVLAGGLAVLALTVGGTATAVAVLAMRRGNAARSAGHMAETSSVVGSGVHLGLPPAPVVGLRFAMERGRGRDAVPVGSVLLGAVLAVGVVVTTLTFGSSLRTLVSQPALYGWNWDYALVPAAGSTIPPEAAQVLDHSPAVAAWTGLRYGNVSIDGGTVPVLVTSPRAAVGPPLVSGHEIRATDEIVLGTSTLTSLHKHLGDTVTVSYGAPADAPIYIPPTPVRIVGTATLPAIGATGTLHTSMGTGAVLSSSLEPAAFRQALVNPDPEQNGPSIEVVRIRPGVPHAAGLAAVQRAAAAATKAFANDPAAGGGVFGVSAVQQPAEIVNYHAMGAVPAVVASGLSAGAVLALALTLLASVRRRRRELALLKTVGFVRRQLAAVVAWQASVAAVVGSVLGVPLGIVVGRALWTLFAHEIGAVTRPTVPPLEVVATVLVALVLANAVAVLPGRLAARTPTAVLLRAE